MEPLITILLTTYNRAHLIGETLDSIIAQTYTNWECIIVDDNSMDNTKIVVNEFVNSDDRIKYLVKDKLIKQGLPAGRNIGIKKAKGQYLVFFDDDDIVHYQLIEICVKEFSKNKNIDFVHYEKQSFEGAFNKDSLELILNFETEQLEGNIYEKIVLGTLPLASCTVMWKTELFEEDLFKEELMYAEEWECYSRILIKNKLRGVYIKEPLYFNRKHSKSNTGEFWSNDPIRMSSYVKAQQLVCENLIDSNLMTNKLKKYFYHKSYTLKSKLIISKLLEQSFMNKVYFWIYPLKFNLYKFLK
ncbi:glycosyltransferase family 2 protein [Wenyingzhuangia sp. chi5]|uniref:Glycosyltransferase family 2 protein n=1 Tax=Wenyingzhuangia gilva TaxID=3057677 RepID=A0ABT8VT21_9FLAO|nr:glycosyltransferase family 2 protein [Wenyingzhuangia sp. chi5]MDO3695122.1 glycosyltransferase family 2 protein [Wenyingzhuangia sp. chi5]